MNGTQGADYSRSVVFETGFARKLLTRCFRVRAARNGAGVKGPGGARVIRATKPSATIAIQNVSQKPSAYASTLDSRCTSADSEPRARAGAAAAPRPAKLSA